MGRTSIEWTDFSINPIKARALATGKVGHHCVKVSPGCKHCYSSRLQSRFGLPPFEGPRLVEHFLDEKALDHVLRRRIPTKWFWEDMSDLFGDWVSDAWLDRCFAVMALTPQHTHILVTKRAARMRAYLTALQAGRRQLVNESAPFRAHGDEAPVRAILDHIEHGFRNVWALVSCENQETADERIPELLATPAAVRGVSCEPLLSALDLSSWLPSLTPWVRTSPSSWADVWPSWMPAKVREDIEIFWSHHGGPAGYGRQFATNWAERVPFGARVHGVDLGGRAIRGRYVHAWNNIGRVIEDDGTVRYVASHDLTNEDPGLDWVIVGGESGPGARPMHPQWARDLRDQCVAARVSYFHKQHGDWLPFYDRDVDDPDWRNVPAEAANVCRLNLAGGTGFHGEGLVYFKRVGKTRAGRVLDGKEWSEFPPPSTETRASA